MTQKEKVEAYDKALERARAINNGKDVDVESGTTTCEYIFPELKEENNNERIKKKPMNLIFQIEVMIYMLLQKIFLFGLKSKASRSLV